MKRLIIALALSVTLSSFSAVAQDFLPTVKIFSYDTSLDGDLLAEGYGSGTLIDNAGVVLTNNHVIEYAYEVGSTYDAFQVCLTEESDLANPQCRFTARLIARDAARDVALLKIDSRDALGNTVNFDFFSPYKNDGDYGVGSEITVIGFPDTGGRTITYTSGLISGFANEGGYNYVKTDADISFGNSGGGAFDEEGNFIGVPTFIVGSYSAEVLGYLIPVRDVVAWIDANISAQPIDNAQGNKLLRDAISRFARANEDGTYANNYPVYEVSLVDGWKFGSALEGVFDGQIFENDFLSGDALAVYPEERDADSRLSLNISVAEYPYVVELDDVEGVLQEVGTFGEFSRTKFNGRYDAIKVESSYTDWYIGNGVEVTTVLYSIPYGNHVINLNYAYAENDEGRLGQLMEILESFELDYSEVKVTVVDELISSDPQITIKKPSKEIFVSDETYEYQGDKYFGASFGKKENLDFYVSLFAEYYYDEVANFEQFEKTTLEDAREIYEVVGEGEVYIDGRRGFYFIDLYGEGDGTYYLSLYLPADDERYFALYYSGDYQDFTGNIGSLKLILNNIQFQLKGAGEYRIPAFSLARNTAEVGGNLRDIDNHLYEDNILNIRDLGAFGINVPVGFGPENAMTRGDFVRWVQYSLRGDVAADFRQFVENYQGCGDRCFVDAGNYDEAFLAFAMQKGALGGLRGDGNYYLAPDQQLSLVAALKILAEIYDYPLWEAPDYVIWYIPYLHFGYQEALIPYGVADSNYHLTRGEASFVLDGVL